MYRKALILPFLLVASFFFASSVFAAANVTQMDGLIFADPPYWNSDGNGNDRYTVDFKTQEVTKIKIQSWSAGYGEMLREKTADIADMPGVPYFTGSNFTCNAYYRAYYYNASGSQVGYIEVMIHDLLQPSCDSGGAGDIPPSEGEKCIGCDLFECPGWSDYMGKLDEIKAAIPPPPNWSAVATTFRDTIAPRIKSDMAELIGTSSTPSLPTLPQAPNKPSTPGSLGGVNDGGISAPTGTEAPGLGDSTFSGDDLKQAAPTIPERSDPTGGFNLVTDPIGGLPSQDDFIKNAPIEGEVPFPSMPTGEETVDPGDEITEPQINFPDIDFNGPDIDYDTPPTPGGGTAAPTDPPSPIEEPTGNYDVAPIPGADGSTAPTPGEGETFGAPYP